ncbi:hypothetical protein M885DRAFT_504066 [Pelagophyceae sp. CCMP2097]|nr:hypothetical protein M885DRAFT_504066 [Pelagophyceae sp. CCMP2097]
MPTRPPDGPRGGMIRPPTAPDGREMVLLRKSRNGPSLRVSWTVPLEGPLNDPSRPLNDPRRPRGPRRGGPRIAPRPKTATPRNLETKVLETSKVHLWTVPWSDGGLGGLGTVLPRRARKRPSTGPQTPYSDSPRVFRWSLETAPGDGPWRRPLETAPGDGPWRRTLSPLSFRRWAETVR